MNTGADILSGILSRTYYGNTVLDYLVFLLVMVVGLVAAKILTAVATRSARRLAGKTATVLDDFLIGVIKKTASPLLYYGVFYIATRNLVLPGAIARAVYVLGVILLTVMAIRFLTAVLVYAMENYWLKGAEDGKRRSVLGLMPAIKTVIWAMGIVFLLDNLGFEISTVIAGLGIGGIAVAMASQAILGDLFSYFAILTDRPFEVGDFIIVGDFLGTVEHVGIKTTRLRSLSGEQLVFSNTDLTGSRVRNYKRMEKRRVVFKLGVVYQTGLDDLKVVPEIIKGVILSIPDTTFDRAHFASFGDFSLDFEVVYYVLSSDYNRYMDIQQKINFAIFEEFEKRGIEFAYPTQTLFVEGSGGGGGAPQVH